MVGLVTEWMDDRLRVGAECVRRATRDSETWDKPSSSSKRCEPFAQSAARGSHETCQGDVRWMSSWRSINNGRCQSWFSIDRSPCAAVRIVGWLVACLVMRWEQGELHPSDAALDKMQPGLELEAPAPAAAQPQL
uniref:Uncharacterized protein n=1 Tax=Hordeum vulgare subsp. vulgare TaxID=112509 RepID=A0A8I6XMU3_HORVV